MLGSQEPGCCCLWLWLVQFGGFLLANNVHLDPTMLRAARTAQTIAVPRRATSAKHAQACPSAAKSRKRPGRHWCEPSSSKAPKLRPAGTRRSQVRQAATGARKLGPTSRNPCQGRWNRLEPPHRRRHRPLGPSERPGRGIRSVIVRRRRTRYARDLLHYGRVRSLGSHKRN